MKRNYWPVFFIGLFSLGFAMIVWTIMSATKVPVHEDETFLKSYQDLNDSFNDALVSNQKFLSKYNFAIKINEKELPLVYNDLFLSQRVIEEKSTHKDILNNGKNVITIDIKDKNNNMIVKDAQINFRVSRPTNHNNTMDFDNKDFKLTKSNYQLGLELPLKGNWNITATFKVGNDVGYFFLKSNAI